jgi:transcriptional regulator with XRE-family HTH domain
MTSFHERLKHEREKRKKSDPRWTQEFVANKIGVARVTYTAYENGTKIPPIETVNRFADFYNVTTDYLLGRTDDYQTNPGDERSNFFYFDKEGLTDEDLEYLKQSVEIMKERARKRAAERKKNNR